MKRYTISPNSEDLDGLIGTSWVGVVLALGDAEGRGNNDLFGDKIATLEIGG